MGGLPPVTGPASSSPAAATAMKKIEAVIHPGKLDDVIAGLRAIGLEGLTMAETKRVVDGDRQPVARYRGAKPITMDTIPRLRIEIVVADFKASQVVETLRRAARTGQPEDDLVAVMPVDDALRVRTGESGHDAL